MIQRVFGQVEMLREGLEMAWVNHQVISNNIANAETPGYIAQEVMAESECAAGECERDYKVVNTDDPVKANGNNVDMESEMAELAKNSILYSALVQKTAMELRRIEYAIDGGGK